jgi:hypothetical protein
MTLPGMNIKLLYYKWWEMSLFYQYNLKSKCLAVAQAACCLFLTAGTRVQSRMTSSEIRSGRSDTRADFSLIYSVFP